MGDYSTWQALKDELLLFPQAEHDDLFDGLQTMMEGALQYGQYYEGVAVAGGSLLPDDFFEDTWGPRYDDL